MQKPDFRFRRRAHGAGWAALASLFSLFGARGQSVIVPPAGSSSRPAAVPSVENLLNWGPVDLRPHLDYSFVHGTGIQSSPGNDETTTIQTLSPGVLFVLGDHWTLDYVPSLTFYSSDAFKDNTSHRVSLGGATRYDDWTFGINQGFSISSDPLVETGQQTDQTSFSTALSAAYQINSKASVNFAISQSFIDTSGFNSSRDWVLNEGFNYAFRPGLEAGLSLSTGYSDVTLGSDMTYETLQGTFRWRLTDKLNLSSSAGAEVRQFLDTAARSAINPIFSASINYQALEMTTISLSGSRAVSASYFDNTINQSTSVSIGLQQRFLKHLQLGVSAGYNTTSYTSESNLDTTRSDDGYSFGASLGISFLKRASFSAFYSYSKNSSSEGLFAYTSNQVGFNLGYRF